MAVFDQGLFASSVANKDYSRATAANAEMVRAQGEAARNYAEGTKAGAETGQIPANAGIAFLECGFEFFCERRVSVLVLVEIMGFICKCCRGDADKLAIFVNERAARNSTGIFFVVCAIDDNWIWVHTK